MMAHICEKQHFVIHVPMPAYSFRTANVRRIEELVARTGKPHLTRGWMGDTFEFRPAPTDGQELQTRGTFYTW